MKKLFISQPMNGKTDDEIRAERQRMIDKAVEHFGEPVNIINSFFDENNPITFLTEGFDGLGHLGMSLCLLSKADAVMFADGWQNFRGCKIEHECAIQYGIPVIGE